MLLVFGQKRLAIVQIDCAGNLIALRPHVAPAALPSVTTALLILMFPINVAKHTAPAATVVASVVCDDWLWDAGWCPDGLVSITAHSLVQLWQLVEPELRDQQPHSPANGTGPAGLDLAMASDPGVGLGLVCRQSSWCGDRSMLYSARLHPYPCAAGWLVWYPPLLSPHVPCRG